MFVVSSSQEFSLIFSSGIRNGCKFTAVSFFFFFFFALCDVLYLVPLRYTFSNSMSEALWKMAHRLRLVGSVAQKDLQGSWRPEEAEFQRAVTPQVLGVQQSRGRLHAALISHSTCPCVRTPWSAPSRAVPLRRSDSLCCQNPWPCGSASVTLLPVGSAARDVEREADSRLQSFTGGEGDDDVVGHVECLYIHYYFFCDRHLTSPVSKLYIRRKSVSVS